MKIVCDKKDMLNAVNKVIKAVPVRTTMPVLYCVLIDASGSLIRLTANDMELGIETIMEGTIEDRGILAINAGIFYDLIRKMPEGMITVSSDENYTAQITGSKAHFQIGGMDGTEFVRLPYVEKDHPIRLSQMSLKDMIGRVLFSASPNDGNKIMTGLFMEVEDGKMRMTALDGHRLAMRTIELNEEADPEEEIDLSVDGDEEYGEEAGEAAPLKISAILPGKTMGEIAKILPGEADSLVSIYVTEKLVMFEFGETVVVSRLIDGEYFNVSHMITRDYETCVRVNRQEFMECLDRSTLIIRDNDKRPVILNITDGVLDMKVDTEIGSMEENMEVSKEGRDIKIGFNPKLLLDAMKAIEDDEIDLYFVNSKSPCFIRDQQESYVYLILPVNFVD